MRMTPIHRPIARMGNRGQHFTEYVVILGVVSTVVMGTQLYVGKSIGGGLWEVAKQIQVDGTPLSQPVNINSMRARNERNRREDRVAAGGIPEKDSSWSRLFVEGISGSIKSVGTTGSRSVEYSGYILAEAYGPWIGTAITLEHDMSSLQFAFTAWKEGRASMMEETDLEGIDAEETDAELQAAFMAEFEDRAKTAKNEALAAGLGLVGPDRLEQLETLMEDEEEFAQALAVALLNDPSMREAVRNTFVLTGLHENPDDQEAVQAAYEQLVDDFLTRPDADKLKLTGVEMLVSAELPETATIAAIRSMGLQGFGYEQLGQTTVTEEGDLSMIVMVNGEARRVLQISSDQLEQIMGVEPIVGTVAVIENLAKLIEEGKEKLASLDGVEDAEALESKIADWEKASSVLELGMMEPLETAIQNTKKERDSADSPKQWDALNDELDLLSEARDGLMQRTATTEGDEDEVEGNELAAVRDRVAPPFWKFQSEGLSEALDEIKEGIKEAREDESVKKVLAAFTEPPGPVELTVRGATVIVTDHGGTPLSDIELHKDAETGVPTYAIVSDDGTTVPVVIRATGDFSDSEIYFHQYVDRNSSLALINDEIPDEDVRMIVEGVLSRYNRFAQHEKNPVNLELHLSSDVLGESGYWEGDWEEAKEKGGKALNLWRVSVTNITSGISAAGSNDIYKRLGTMMEEDEESFIEFVEEVKSALTKVSEDDRLFGAFVTKGVLKGLRREDSAKVADIVLKDEEGNEVLKSDDKNWFKLGVLRQKPWTLDGTQYEGGDILYHEDSEYVPIGIDTNGDDKCDVCFGTLVGRANPMATDVYGSPDENGEIQWEGMLTLELSYEGVMDKEGKQRDTGNKLVEVERKDQPQAAPQFDLDGNTKDAELFGVMGVDGMFAIQDSGGNHQLDYWDFKAAEENGTVIEILDDLANASQATPEGMSLLVVDQYRQMNDNAGSFRIVQLGDSQGAIQDGDHDGVADIKEFKNGDMIQMSSLRVYNPEASGERTDEMPEAIRPVDWNDHHALSEAQVSAREGTGGSTRGELRAAQMGPEDFEGIDFWEDGNPSAVSGRDVRMFRASQGMGVIDVMERSRAARRNSSGQPPRNLQLPTRVWNVSMPQGPQGTSGPPATTAAAGTRQTTTPGATVGIRVITTPQGSHTLSNATEQKPMDGSTQQHTIKRDDGTILFEWKGAPVPIPDAQKAPAPRPAAAGAVPIATPQPVERP